MYVHSSARRTAALPPETFRFAPSLPLRFACGPHPSNGPEGGHGFRRREPPARRRSTTVSSLLLRGVSTPGREMLPTAKFQRIISSRAQKNRFCARNARKRGFRRSKAHKNLDFVLESPENEGSEGKKRTKTSILCSGRRGLALGRKEMSIGKHNNGLPANHRAHHQNINT